MGRASVGLCGADLPRRLLGLRPPRPERADHDWPKPVTAGSFSLSRLWSKSGDAVLTHENEMHREKQPQAVHGRRGVCDVWSHRSHSVAVRSTTPRASQQPDSLSPGTCRARAPGMSGAVLPLNLRSFGHSEFGFLLFTLEVT